MAFGVEELRVLRRALALALQPTPASAEDVQDCLRLAESLDEAMREGARLRAFLVADLARYRAALPGTAVGYLTLLQEALSAGYRPDLDDLAALRALRGNPVAAALLNRCRLLAEQDVRARPARRAVRPAIGATPTVPACRTPLLALPGGRCATAEDPAERGAPRQRGTAAPAPDLVVKDPGREPSRKPAQKPAERPERPAAPKPTPAPKPSRPIPTPGEVFPRRKPTPPPAEPPQQLAAG
ncbi:hypothetical protein CLM62_18750 [Streptomyces sp. SA15]|uniref:hypothetical protein n=1 Tax=Streptomyces sp. SA15 TaxID=934019 RepID=UPI000BB0413B|nr:hypothetical protein [Streptomyces sp. SA15]PAZ14469.1 hypothetical protein CLM62_18750 [Streptomyces sp. SA15]